MKQLFTVPVIISLVILAAVYAWGGTAALFLAGTLAILEVTLSFDNAIINAKVLQLMPALWQKRFLTWGMLFSVLGVRLVLPILIVSVVAAVSPWAITTFAFSNPAQYGLLIDGARPAIEAFGGMFLLLVALRYFFDETKSVHWLGRIERRLSRWGQIEAIGIALALSVLFLVALLSPASPLLILKSGLIGAVLFILVEGITDILGAESKSALRAGAGLFIYLNVLDAAFSFDGVVGAFALTTLVSLIVVGLGIGAYFVRTMTMVLVHGGTLRRLIYLEHGAHWAIMALSLCMLGSLITPVPQWFIASVGLVVIAFAYFSSRRAVRRA